MNAAKKSKSLAGDLIFFAALLFLVAMTIGCVKSVWFVFNTFYWQRFFSLLAGFSIGIAIAFFLIRGYLSVFFHELKHAVVALLAGNSPKGLRIGKEEGHFEYSFTKDNESYNAFIFLAPYSLPLCTVIFFLAGIYPLFHHQTALIAFMGIGYGIDTLTGIRDIHPGQTDFSRLVGGFGIGIIYVMAMHILIMVSLVTWSLGGINALENLFLESFKYIFPAASLLKSDPNSIPYPGTLP